MVSKTTPLLRLIAMHDSSYTDEGCNFIAKITILDSYRDPFTTFYFICQSLPDQNSISTPSRVTGCAVFLTSNDRFADELENYASHSSWSSISRFSSLRYLVCATANPATIATWANTQQELREFAAKQLFYHRLFHSDPESDGDNPAWIGVHPLSLEKTGEWSFRTSRMLRSVVH